MKAKCRRCGEQVLLIEIRGPDDAKVTVSLDERQSFFYFDQKNAQWYETEGRSPHLCKQKRKQPPPARKEQWWEK